MRYCLLLRDKVGRKDILMVYSWMYKTRKDAALAARKRNVELQKDGYNNVFVTPRILFEDRV